MANKSSGETKKKKNKKPSFEQSLERLETLVHDLEHGQVGLAESLASYEEGVKLLKECHQLLEKAERRIELLSGVDADGNPIVQPLDEDADASLEEKAASRSRRRSQPRPSQADTEPDSDMDVPGGLF
ncbi:MAG: exodeoxyribonuclease VII small subunit [Planctomycetes bacterium]|nr:exodeoxyribonuclease VII small subunit [Planctomycetota bacterium]